MARRFTTSETSMASAIVLAAWHDGNPNFPPARYPGASCTMSTMGLKAFDGRGRATKGRMRCEHIWSARVIIKAMPTIYIRVCCQRKSLHSVKRMAAYNGIQINFPVKRVRKESANSVLI